jgi:hypothetical protein
MLDDARRRKLLADLESARDAYRLAAEEFDRAFTRLAEHPDDAEELRSAVSTFHAVVRRYHTAMEACLDHLRQER